MARQKHPHRRNPKLRARDDGDVIATRSARPHRRGATFVSTEQIAFEIPMRDDGAAILSLISG
jgi:hypothetical protein